MKCKDSSYNPRLYDVHIRWSGDAIGRAIFDGYVVTPQGIVGARGDFSLKKGYTRLEFVYRGRKYVRECDKRGSTGTIGKMAREFVADILKQFDVKEAA